MTYEDMCKTIRPSEYADGEGFSPAGSKVKELLEYMDSRACDYDPCTDASWGFLTPEALAEDEAAWEQLMHEGRL